MTSSLTLITGFFISAMGMGLIFNGVVEFLQSYGIMTDKIAGSCVEVT